MFKTCIICDKKFNARGKIRKETAKFCSIKCKSIFQKGKNTWNKGKKIWLNKQHPRGMLGKIPWNKGKKGVQVAWNKGKKFSKETRRKMSLAHKGKYTGENNPRWNNGIKKMMSGYITIASPNHPLKGKYGYVFKHRLVMEKKLGRYLLPEEVVHHLNKIKNDNRIENLKLFATTGKHSAFHKTIKKS